jgi:hypothetical protein
MTHKRLFPTGTLVSPKVAADLAGIDTAELDSLIRRGGVRSATIRGRLFVDLDDADRIASRQKRAEHGATH